MRKKAASKKVKSGTQKTKLLLGHKSELKKSPIRKMLNKHLKYLGIVPPPSRPAKFGNIIRNAAAKIAKISKKQLVKNWLLSGRTITDNQCRDMFGANRLADIIFKLRGEGMNIESPLRAGKDRFLNDVEYAEY